MEYEDNIIEFVAEKIKMFFKIEKIFLTNVCVGCIFISILV